jgi:hypothetical protein
MRVCASLVVGGRQGSCRHLVLKELLFSRSPVAVITVYPIGIETTFFSFPKMHWCSANQ